MPREKVHGINAITRRSKTDGRVLRVDYYHRDSGLHLGTDLDEAKRRAAQIGGEPARRAPPPATVFDGLCVSYLSSDRFRRLAPASKKLNELYIRKLLPRFSGLPVAAITRPVVVAFREKLSREIEAADRVSRPTRKTSLGKGQDGCMTPNVAKHLVNKLQLLLTHAADTGIIPVNPALHPEAGFGVLPRATCWSPEQIAAFLDAAPPTIRVAASVLLFTAQRPSDVTGLRWEAIRERDDGLLWITLVQAKTGALVDVPCHRTLAAILRAVPEERRVGLLLPSPRAGIRWQYRNFSRAWDRTASRADYRLARRLFAEGLHKEDIRPRLLKGSGVQRRDLRRTSMLRMAEAGATDAQIAAVRGHSIEQTRNILDVYIPRRGQTAARAIKAWENLDDGADPQLIRSGVAKGVAKRPT